MPAQFISAPAEPLLVDLDIPQSGLFFGIPAAVSYANLLDTSLALVLEHYMNEALEEHVNEVRETLSKDDDYHDLARYYDVVQDEDEANELVFAFYGLPPNLRAKADVLEYGDEMNVPRAFMRTTVFSGVRSLFKGLGNNIDYSIDNVVMSSA